MMTVKVLNFTFAEIVSPKLIRLGKITISGLIYYKSNYNCNYQDMKQMTDMRHFGRNNIWIQPTIATKIFFLKSLDFKLMSVQRYFKMSFFVLCTWYLKY